MGKKKLNRDLALKVLEVVGAMRDALYDLLDTMFIIYQPKDATGAIGDTVTFTVVAMNVDSYQWETSKIGTTTWANATSSGNTTDTITLTIASATYNYRLRCKLTDADGNIIYTDEVFIFQP